MEKNLQNNKIEHIYIHIPFCLKKCPYCSFYSESFKKDNVDTFLHYLIKEIKLFADRFDIAPVTIYFGGGTPSLLKPYQIQEIINLFDTSKTEEITLEANPATLTENYIKNLTETEVNRISIGVQSMIDSELKTLGRVHKATQIYQIVENLRSNGFENISLDLMYGLPKQTVADVEYSLRKMIDLAPEHISTYCLSLDNDVPMYKLINQLPDDDVLNKMYYTIRKELVKSDYIHYEISNFAKSGYYSKHNLSYWSDKSYIGLGPSAAGYIDKKRYENTADLNSYFKQIENEVIMKNAKKLSVRENAEEYLFLGLRKSEGINLKEFKKRFGGKLFSYFSEKIDKFIQKGILIKKDKQVYLAPAYYFVSNEIFSSLLLR